MKLLFRVLTSYELILGCCNTFVVDSDFANLSPLGSVIVLSATSSSALAPARSSGPNIDIGPWCKFNSATKTLVNSPETIWPVYNFTIPNSTCGSDPTCTRSGCVKYRETAYKSGIQQWEGCSVVFPWWYAAGTPGNKTSLPCPLFDNSTSTFQFNGVTYYNLMFNYGHPYDATNCHMNILCSTSGIWFDSTQYSSLKWCQPTPIGWYSPQCNNTKLPCNTGGIDMTLKYFYSHGMGTASGCGIRNTAPAVVPIPNGLDPFLSAQFYMAANLSLSRSVSGATAASKPSIVFGLLGKYFVGIFSAGGNDLVQISLFHSNWTVTSQNSILSSAPFTWSSWGGFHKIAVQGDGSNISFWFDEILISTVPQVPSTATLGTLNLTGLSSNFTDGTILHVGFFSVGIPGDWIGSTTAINGYSANNNFASIEVAKVEVSNIASLTTTTSAPSTSQTTTGSTTSVTVSVPTTSTTASSTGITIQSIGTDSVPTTTKTTSWTPLGGEITILPASQSIQSTTFSTETTSSSAKSVTTSMPITSTTSTQSTTASTGLTSTEYIPTTPIPTETTNTTPQLIALLTSLSTTRSLVTTSVPTSSTASATIALTTTTSATAPSLSTTSLAPTSYTQEKVATSSSKPQVTSSTTVTNGTGILTIPSTSTAPETTQMPYTSDALPLSTLTDSVVSGNSGTSSPVEIFTSHSFTSPETPAQTSMSATVSTLHVTSPSGRFSTVSSSPANGNGGLAQNSTSDETLPTETEALIGVASVSASILVLLSLTLCVLRYKCAGSLNLVRRGARRVARIANSTLIDTVNGPLI